MAKGCGIQMEVGPQYGQCARQPEPCGLRRLPLFELRGAGESDVTRQVQGRTELSGECFDLPAGIVKHGGRNVGAELLPDPGLQPDLSMRVRFSRGFIPEKILSWCTLAVFADSANHHPSRLGIATSQTTILTATSVQSRSTTRPIPVRPEGSPNSPSRICGGDGSPPMGGGHRRNYLVAHKTNREPIVDSE
jgi:hypothetical protein